MNIKNNKRRQASQESIETVFIALLQTKPISQITVSDICKKAKLNRSTFYANYADVYDLADTIRNRLESEVNQLYGNDFVNQCGLDYLALFRHIRDNQGLYNTYFLLGYDTTQTINLEFVNHIQLGFPRSQLEYHIEFHKAGLNAIIKKWLKTAARSPRNRWSASLPASIRAVQ